MAGSATEYAIEIATRMTGGDGAVAQLSALADRLTGAGTAVSTFEAAIAQTRTALEAAAASSRTAAEALAAGQAQYSELEKSANLAAKAVEKATLKGGVPPDLQAKATAAAAALKGEAVALDALRSKATSAAAAETRLAAGLKNLEAGAKSAAAATEKLNAATKGTQNFGKVASNLQQLGGPIGTLGGKAFGLADAFGDMSEALGAGLGGVVTISVAAVAAVVAVTVAIGAAIVKTAQWAVSLADANRSAALNVEAIASTSAALSNLGSILPGITRSTGLGADELGGFARQLAAAKVSADDMPAALRAVAMAEADLKGQGAGFIADLKAGKKSVAELAAEVGKGIGGRVASKMLSLDEQTKTLKRNMADTFGGLNIEGLLGAMTKLVGLFDKNTAMGRAIKVVFEGIFQPLVNAATASIPVVEALLLGLAIGAFKTANAFKPAIKAVGQLFGAAGTEMPDALQTAAIVGQALAAAIGAAAIALAIVGAAVATTAAPFVLLYVAGSKAAAGIKAGFTAVATYLSGISLSSIGMKIIQGLASGITSAGSKVLSAITGVVGGAIDGAKKLLGIASPSKVFEGIGGFTAEGFAGGVEDGSAAPQSALEAMVAPPSPKAGTGGAGASGAGGLDLSGATFNFYGVKDAEDAEGRIGALLTRIIEGDLSQLGAQPEPAT